jgi:RNA polymerase subunit RPABC4/transcription elongation factor Spt4
MVPDAGQALSPSFEGDGNIFIGEDFDQATLVIGDFVVNGDMTIRAGGVVIVENGCLKFRSYGSDANMLIIEDGGQLILRNAELKAEGELFNAIFALGVLIRNDGSLIAEDSNLNFNGKILVDDATFIAKRTTINGPLFTAMSSQVVLHDSEMINIPATPVLSSLAYPYPFAMSYNQATEVDFRFERNPDTALSQVPIGQNAEDLALNDLKNVTLTNGQSLSISGFDIGGLVFNEGEAIAVTLNAQYKTSSGYVSVGDVFHYNEYLGASIPAMPINPTYEVYDPSINKEVTVSQSLTGLGMSSMDLSVFSVTLTNNAVENVYIDRIWIEVVLRIPAYHNITVAGTSEFTAVNSALGVNYNGYSSPDYRKFVVMDAAQANLYGVSVNGIFNPLGENPYVTKDRELSFKPMVQGSSDTTTEPDVLGLLIDDGLYTNPLTFYSVNGGEVMHIAGFVTGGLNADVSNPVLSLKYRTDITFSSSYVQYYLNDDDIKTSNILISQADSIEAARTFGIGDYPITSIANISELNILYNNINLAGVEAYIGYLELTAFVTPSINVYRWADIHVLDSNGLPISGAIASVTDSTGQPAQYYYGGTWNEVPPQTILDYLGKSVENYLVSDSVGRVLVPLRTDLINSEWEPNSYVTESYNIAVEYTDINMELFSTFKAVPGFQSYPNLGTQIVNVPVTLPLGINDLNIDGTSVLELVDMSLTIQGSIVVENEGHLELIGTQLSMRQSLNQVTKIIVRDNGTLVLDQSTLTSNALLNVYLFDNGALYLNRTTLDSTVALIMDDYSAIYADQSVIMGDVRAPATSHGSLTAMNTTFGRGWSYFGGDAHGELTGVTLISIPPLSLKDRAVVEVYKWLLVTVYDGTGHVLPQANVNLYEFDNDMVGSEISNSNGSTIFRVHSATVTAAGFYTNLGYRAQATYLYNGTSYESTTELIQAPYPDATGTLVGVRLMASIEIPGALPDLSPIISVSTEEPLYSKQMTISATVYNHGVVAAYDVLVRFEDNSTGGKTIISDQIIAEIGPGENVEISIIWTATNPVGDHTIEVTVDPLNAMLELDEGNNFDSTPVTVIGVPDLVVTAADVTVFPTSPVKNHIATIFISVKNIGQNPADSFMVKVLDDGAEFENNTVIVEHLSVDVIATVQINWMPAYSGTHYLTVIADSNATVIESIENNNQVVVGVAVLDFANLNIENGRTTSLGVDVTSGAVGENIHILFDIENVGAIDAVDVNVRVYLVGGTTNLLLNSQVQDFEIGQTVQYNISWIVNVTAGAYSVVIWADAEDESDIVSNVLDMDFAVTAPIPIITINLGGKTDYAPGTSIFVQGTVKNSGNQAPLVGQTIKIKITDKDGFAPTSTITTTTNANGQFATYIPVPTGKEGDHLLNVTVETIAGNFYKTADIDIIAPFAPESIPSWVYLLIVAIVIAVIVIFSLYLYRVGLGRMVECGNCGALIPEASRHCPKCGVEFESDTAKCSECGAWIPSKAESCPDCGAKFMTEPVEAGQAPGYIEAMRRQYDEYIEAFRGQAKAALGSKYSEEKFMEWLQTEPNYLPFEEWLRKEEMSRRSGVFPCPACGTLNPRDSKICNRCGTVFDQQGKSEAPKAEEKKSPFRRIVRRTGEQKNAPSEQVPESTEPRSEESGDKPQ